MAELVLDHVPLDSLIPHPGNPRRGNVDLIAASIDAHTLYLPLVVQTTTRHICVGNHRWHALRQLGHDTVPVVWRDVDNDEAWQLLLIDNRSSDLATNDEQALADALTYLSERGKLALAGFDDTDLVDLLNRLAPPSLDDLEGQYGRPDDAAIWPMVNIRLPPDYYSRFKTVLEAYPGETDSARLCALIDGHG